MSILTTGEVCQIYKVIWAPCDWQEVFKIDPEKQYFFLGPSKTICKHVVLCDGWQKVVICSDNLQGNIPVRQLDLVQQRPKELVQFDILPQNSDCYVYLQKSLFNIIICKKNQARAKSLSNLAKHSLGRNQMVMVFESWQVESLSDFSWLTTGLIHMDDSKQSCLFSRLQKQVIVQMPQWRWTAGWSVKW